MDDRRVSVLRLASLVLLLVAALTAAPALAADESGAADARARYEQERAACAEGRSTQDRATCLREAAAAYAQAKRGEPEGGSAAQYLRNATRRCEPLPEEQRKACIARMQGQGTTRGSVAGGGIYRELVTREVGPPDAPKADADAPATSPAPAPAPAPGPAK